MIVGWMGMWGGDGHADNLLLVIPSDSLRKWWVIVFLLLFYFVKNVLFLHYCGTNIIAVLCFAIYIANFMDFLKFYNISHSSECCLPLWQSKNADIEGETHVPALPTSPTPHFFSLPLKSLSIGKSPPPAPISPPDTIHGSWCYLLETQRFKLSLT